MPSSPMTTKKFKRGKLITFEGPDGAGKTTQCQLLKETMEQNSLPVRLIKFPQKHIGSTERWLKEYLQGHFSVIDPKAIAYQFALNRFDVKSEMEDILSKGTHLLIDRYVGSNMAHQGARSNQLDPTGQKEFCQWVYHIEFEELGIPKPDLQIILDCRPEIAKKLREKRNVPADILEKDFEHQQRAYQLFKNLPAYFPELKFLLVKCAPNGSFDKIKTPQAIHEEIWEYLKQQLLS